MKICLVNMDATWKDKNQNLYIIENHIKNIKEIELEIDTIIFPECSLTWYILEENLSDIEESKNDFCVNEIKTLSKKYNVNLIAWFIEKSKTKKPYNSSFVTSKNEN